MRITINVNVNVFRRLRECESVFTANCDQFILINAYRRAIQSLLTIANDGDKICVVETLAYLE